MSSPKNGRILVTGVGGDIGANILRCLQEGPDAAAVIGCDQDPLAFGREYVSSFHRCPSAAQTDEYRRFVQEMIDNEDVRFIYPSSEREIAFFHQHRSDYEGAGIHLLINNATILDAFLDKFKTVEFLKSHRLPAPQTWLLADYQGSLPYPFILKKRFGSGSKLVLIVSNESEFVFYKAKYAPQELIVQEYLGDVDHEFTGGVFSDGQQTFSILFRRYLASDVGITKYAEFVEDPDFHHLAEKVAKATRLRGSINIQLRRVQGKLVPFEINPRISGTAYVRHHFQFRDIQWWLDLVQGRPIQFVPKYTQGVAVRAISEVFMNVC